MLATYHIGYINTLYLRIVTNVSVPFTMNTFNSNLSRKQSSRLLVDLMKIFIRYGELAFENSPLLSETWYLPKDINT